MPTTTIELVRHAKAHSRDRWWGRPDQERPLTDAGAEQARAIAEELRASGAPIAALRSSPYVRCVQTLAPLGEILGLEIAHDGALGEATRLAVTDGGDGWVSSAWLGGRALALVEGLLREHPGDRLVLCSHGDVVPALLAVLVGRDGLDLPDVRVRKGGRVTLRFDGATCVDAEPHPPPD